MAQKPGSILSPSKKVIPNVTIGNKLRWNYRSHFCKIWQWWFRVPWPCRMCRFIQTKPHPPGQRRRKTNPRRWRIYTLKIQIDHKIRGWLTTFQGHFQEPKTTDPAGNDGRKKSLWDCLALTLGKRVSSHYFWESYGELWDKTIEENAFWRLHANA